MIRTIYIVLLLLNITLSGSGGDDGTETSGENLHPILLNRNTITVPEGGSATFAVKLGFQPESEIIVTIAVSAGDTDISITTGSKLIFTRDNWDIYQVVTLSAMEDNDKSPGVSIITATSPSAKTAIIRAMEKDDDLILSILSGNGGTTSPSGTTVLDPSEGLNLKAIPDSGFHFKMWVTESGSAVFSSLYMANTTVQISGNSTVKAYFETNVYTVEFSAGQNGNIRGVNPQSINYGDNSTPVEAVPNENYEFTGWSGDHIGIENPITLIAVKTNKLIYAQFKIIDTDNDGMPDFWELKHGFAKNDPADAKLDKDNDKLDNLAEYQRGTDPANPDTDADTYSDGAEVAAGTDPLDPLSMPEYKILLENDILSINEDSTANVGVKLSEEPPEDIKISVSLIGESHGVVLTSNPELTFTPANWDNWQYLEFSASKDDNPSVEIAQFKLETGLMYGIKILQVIKKKADINVNISNNGNGKTTPEGSLDFCKGQALSITATPSLNYHFTNWTGVPDENKNDNPLNITVEKAMEIFANFAENTVKYRAQVELDGFLQEWTFVSANFAGGYKSDVSIRCATGSPQSFLDNLKIQGVGINIQDGFESATIGAAPDNWNFNSPDLGTIRVVGTPVSEGQKALKISGAENDNQEIFYPGSVSQQNSILSFDVFIPNGTGTEEAVTSVIYRGTHINFNTPTYARQKAIFKTEVPSSLSFEISPNEWHNAIIYFDKMTDTDFDGLDDEWEILNFGNLAQDGNGDFDGDGVSDLQEFQDRTDPKSQNERFAFEKELTTVPESAGTVNIKVILSKPQGETVSVNVGLLNTSATEDEDFKLKPQTLRFAPGTTVATASIIILSDKILDEPDEEINLTLENPCGANIGVPATHKITVKEDAEDSDNDGLPDLWEMKFFGNLDQKPENDPDNDGVNNIIEYKQGRHPNAGAKKDATDRLKLKVSY